MIRAIALALSFAVGCAAAAAGMRQTGIPEGAEARQALAIELWLSTEADAERAIPVIDAALGSAPNDPANHLLRGLERSGHGYFGQARESILTALELIAQSPNDDIGLSAIRQLGLLTDLAPNFRAQVEPRLGAVLAQLGPRSGYSAAELLIGLAYGRGDMQRVEELRRSRGCIGTWHVVGPFGPRAMLSFDVDHEAGAFGPMKALYSNPPFEDLARRTHQARGCLLDASDLEGWRGGATYAEAFFDAESAGPYTVRLETSSSVELSIDSRKVVRRDQRGARVAQVSYHRVELDKGQHELRIKLVDNSPNASFSLSIIEANESRHPAAPLGEALQNFFTTERLISDGDIVGAREHLSAIGAEKSRSATTLFTLAQIQVADPLKSETARRDSTRATLRRFQQVDPLAWYPALQLARLAQYEGRRDEAVELLEAAVRSWPRVVSLRTTLADVFAARGWVAPQERQLKAAQALGTDGCEVASAMTNLARSRNQLGSLDELVRAEIRCNAGSYALFRHLIQTRRWADASTELERLALFEPVQSRYRLDNARAALARAQGKPIEAQLTALLAAQPRNADLVLELSDLALAQGKRKQALSTMGEAIRRYPQAMGLVREIRNVLSKSSEFDGFRLDGQKVIREYEKSNTGDDHPQVLVLDYSVSRVFSDYSAMDLTHNIFKVQSDEAVDAIGEFTPPAGADLLKIRTIKPDGTVLEPDWIGGKESISLPNLAPGDYVEYEFLRWHDPASRFPGGVHGDRFTFTSFDTPFARSEYVVILPKSFDVQLDSRGNAPPLERKVKGDLQVLRWRSDNNVPVEVEPDSVHASEYMPSVSWAVNAGWEPLFETVVEAVAGQDPDDPALRRLVSEITAGADGPRERAKRLYDWTMVNIESTQDALGLAPAMVHDRTGHRSRVVHYLFGLAGLEADLLLARGFTSDQTPTEFADGDVYTGLLVRVKIDGQFIYLEPTVRSMPFGFLSLVFRDQDAIVLKEPFERVVVQDTSGFADHQRVDAEVELRSDGSAKVQVVEQLTGINAVQWRENLRAIPKAELEQRFEEYYVSAMFPGGELRSLRIENETEYAAPLVLRYEMEVGRYARRQGEHMYLPTIFRTQAGANYARRPNRKTTQLVVQPTDLTFSVRVALPPGVNLVDPREALAWQAMDNASFEQSAPTQTGRVLSQTRGAHIPRMRVSPGDYPGFVAFCRNIDRVESGEIELIFAH